MARRSHAAAAAITVLGLLGCDDGNPVGPRHAVEIYLVSGFDAVAVDIAIDGVPLYDGTVGATPISGPAATLYTSLPTGGHQIRVRTGERATTADLALRAPVFVMIWRDMPTGDVRVTTTPNRPLWD